MLPIAIELVYLCLPAVGRAIGTEIEISDRNDQAKWIFGEVQTTKPVAEEFGETARMTCSTEIIPGKFQAQNLVREQTDFPDVLVVVEIGASFEDR